MNARELFDAMGVIQQSEAAIFRFFVDARAHEVRIRDAQTRLAPTKDTRKYVAEVTREDGPDRSKYWDIVLETEDPRDVMAFCYAAQNGTQFSVTGDPIPEEHLFSWEDTAMHNAFADETYGDWTGEQRTDWPHNDDGRAILVPDPTKRAWGKEYVEWRDGLADRLTGQPQPAPGV